MPSNHALQAVRARLSRYLRPHTARQLVFAAERGRWGAGIVVVQHSRIAILVLCAALGSGCQSVPGRSSGPTYAGGDGSTLVQAVVIRGDSDAEVTDAEYPWLRAHYPGCRVKNQALVNENQRAYDAMTIETAEGKEVVVYFDITSGFGKW